MATATITRIRIPVTGGELEGELSLPEGSPALVLFAHGSGSSRTSPRNRYVARCLGLAGIGTLLFDLLTEDEDADTAGAARLDIPLLASRLTGAARWVARERRDAPPLRIGYFGASTGAAAALRAAAEDIAVRAVISRGGRLDLAGPMSIAHVRAPTLLIVGGADTEILRVNRGAYDMLRCPKQIEVVPDATHLFEEPGAIERVGEIASAWFHHWLVAPAHVRA